MASLPILTVLEQAQVSPPEATVGDRLLPLTYFDFLWLAQPPIHNIFFYELFITQTQFIQTIIPNLKHSLSITLQHFFPFAGNLLVFPTSAKKPEIRYVEGDSVAVTFAESNLDFNELTANHPRDCEKFYHLIPPLDHVQKTSDSTKIPLFFVQVTLFSNSGISIGMTNHHCLGDASTRFNFLKAWTSIAQSGSDESFLANGTMPFYDRLIKNPKLDESYLKFARLETFKEYQPPKLEPTDKVRATFILPRTVLLRLKELVTTQVPTIAYVSCFSVACAYIWSCIASSTHENELQVCGFAIDCRARMNPALPASYFGNCVGWCYVPAQSKVLTGKEGFVTAAKLLGESLHERLTDKDGIMKDIVFDDLFSSGVPPTIIGIAGTPKLKFYDMDFGWGKPRKIETVSIDYSQSVSMNACREKDEDLEIGLSLPINQMKLFVNTFEEGLKPYV
ncbi:putative anthocyanin 6''-O-malonyltransferase [Helianthus annuus]|uniref:Putative transferase, Chloramphenicol acetyltransferase-like domain protein n=1 Tax=Helianthus annuus TaxID=4232 RepID=A0A1Y3BXX5_HELAN|nr:putative anthocyanin 6''-O-malonyltransferase [Helianthus annuus]KAJ0441721.1 putative anthocyanin 6''-O-malonyltransferase [Helianthus annuus]KAJ0459635.1 putative anthocyanin 6''-O-malonyltransferase [Helianthus annuus]KAJ0640123.1 putative anthocyanin 6''-O-malonyltransferase [Helianthus annuus]KAJ0644080.1 putative anthocyanin 6''-O-malonyltransferase [Helianthus annuus]